MKAKTVWVHIDAIDAINAIADYWYDSDGIWFSYNADVRWVNCFGRKSEGTDMFKSGKLLGDSD